MYAVNVDFWCTGQVGIDFRLGRRGQTRRHGASSSVTGLGKSMESKDEIIK